MLGKRCNLGNFHQAWVVIWSMEVSPKVKHFLQRICTKFLPIHALLSHRHLVNDAPCPWGCDVVESASHDLFVCPRVFELWVECGCEKICESASTLNMRALVEIWSKYDKNMITKGVFQTQFIWGDQNQMVFQNKWTPTMFQWSVLQDWF